MDGESKKKFLLEIDLLWYSCPDLTEFTAVTKFSLFSHDLFLWTIDTTFNTDETKKALLGATYFIF